MRAFKDDCGFGHLGRFGDTGRVKKLLRFDPPNIVRHGGVSGFEEEFHIIPIAPYRTRVLLRQHLPKGPILSTVTGLPGMVPFLTGLVNNWNNHIALEDASVMMGQVTYFLTCLLAYLLTYLLTCSLTHLLTYSLAYLLTYLLTCLLTHLPTRLLTDLLTRLLPYLPTYLLTY